MYQKRSTIKVGCYICMNVSSWVGSVVSNDKDNGAHWPEQLLLC